RKQHRNRPPFLLALVAVARAGAEGQVVALPRAATVHVVVARLGMQLHRPRAAACRRHEGAAAQARRRRVAELRLLAEVAIVVLEVTGVRCRACRLRRSVAGPVGDGEPDEKECRRDEAAAGGMCVYTCLHGFVFLSEIERNTPYCKHRAMINFISYINGL